MDNQEFFDMYMADSKENLGLISQTILYLESDPTNKEYIQEIFRAAHTIKGSAGQMQFTEIANVTHKLEDLFGALRDDKISASSDVIDVVFKTLDCLDALHEQLEDPSIEVDTSVINDIITILNGKPQGATTKATTTVTEVKTFIGETLDSTSRFNDAKVRSTLFTPNVASALTRKNLTDNTLYYINAVTTPSCEYKGVRMFMLLDALSTVGELVTTYPSVDAIEADTFNSTNLDILIASTLSESTIETAFSSVLEIEVNECTDITSFAKNNSASLEEVQSIVSDNVNVVEKEISIVEAKEAPQASVPAIPVVETKPEASKEVAPQAPVQKVAPQAPAKQKTNKEANLYVRVHTKTLDTLLNEQGELLLEYNRLCSVLDRGRKGELTMNELISNLDDIGTNINKINSTQQSIIMSTRMFSLEQLFSIFPRMIRDLSSSLHKQVNLEIEGQDTELDRTILEKVSDPLKHIIRNAVDHGIESPEERVKAGKPEKGTILLSAKQESDSVIITVKDDGKGMDPEALKRKAVEKGIYTQSQVEKLSNEEVFGIIFMPGFSTAKQITEVSGRGVGMDIVRSSLGEIGGVVLIDSKLGEGTTFTVKIPLTLAISKALLVTVEKEKYIVLLNYIQEVTEVDRETEIKRIQHKDHIVIRGEKIYPLVYLRDVYGYPEKKNATESVILIQNNGRQIGLVADSFLGQQDIVVKSLNKYFGGQVKYEAGITKLGDGSIPIIVDVPAVMETF